MHTQENIVFIGDYLFPEGDAAAIRTLSLARICRDIGFGVTVIGKGQLRPRDYRSELAGHYIEGIRYETMNPERISWTLRARHPIGRLTQSKSALEARCTADTRAVVINASGSARHVPFVSAFCRRRAIPLIGDVCEWYDPCQMRHGYLSPSYAIFNLVFRFVLPRLENFIVVSKLLERHFEGRGRNVMRITAPLDVCEIPYSAYTQRVRRVFLYAGQPGRKDLLKEVLQALVSLDPAERARLEFRILGLTQEELRRLLGSSVGLLDSLGDTVRPLGRVPHDQVFRALAQADYTVLVRPNKRYANAGFPSKVPESLAAGVPVVLNLTSDLGEYLGDGTAAIPIRDCSAAEVAKAIRRALELGQTELQELRRNARAKAEQCFDYRLYLKPLEKYLGHLH